MKRYAIIPLVSALMMSASAHAAEETFYVLSDTGCNNNDSLCYQGQTVLGKVDISTNNNETKAFAEGYRAVEDGNGNASFQKVYESEVELEVINGVQTAVGEMTLITSDEDAVEAITDEGLGARIRLTTGEDELGRLGDDNPLDGVSSYEDCVEIYRDMLEEIESLGSETDEGAIGGGAVSYTHLTLPTSG